MGSEAVEDCVQGALSSLYPPFESTAPPLLSQVFSVLESTYQHDSVRYLLDFFIPAKHLLHRLQQHACSQYLGCLFLHSGWPLCLGEKVVVQLSTLDWRLLRANDFYLQVVPFSTRCPRLALKCLALGGRNVQEVLVPESQHPLVFTAEWLHCVNKERGCKREGGGSLDTCLVSTSDGVVRIPWDEVVYPKLLHNPSDLLSDCPSTLPSSLSYLSPNTGGLGWHSSSGEPDSWSWDEEDDLSPDGTEAEIESALGRLRMAKGYRTSSDRSGDYVELLEPRGGPDGDTDPKQQRYLEMHGVYKTRTLPLCRRSKAVRVRRGKAWGYSSRTGSLRRKDSASSRKDCGGACRDSVDSRPPPRVIDLVRDRRACLSEGAADPGDTDSREVYLKGPDKVRRPGVGQERTRGGSTLPWEERHKVRSSKNRPSSGSTAAEQSDQDQGFHSDSVFEDDKSLADTSDAGEKPQASRRTTQTTTDRKSDSGNSKHHHEHGAAEDQLTRLVTETAEKVSPRGRGVKVGGYRAPRRKRKGKRGKGKGRSGQRGNPKNKEDPGSSRGQKKPGPAPKPSTEKLSKVKDPDHKANANSANGIGNKDKPDTTSPERPPAPTEPSASPEHPDRPAPKTSPPLLRDLNVDLLRSGKVLLTGTVDRLGRGLVVTEPGVPEEQSQISDAVELLRCYYTISRASVREKGLVVLVDSRKVPPSPFCCSALRSFKTEVPAGLWCVLILTDEEQTGAQWNLDGIEVHAVRGTKVLQQYVDKQQLVTELDGDFHHSHSDWLSFRLSLEQLSENCESALSLLEEALQRMKDEPLPDTIKSVPLSVQKHQQLMANVLADQRLTELQRRGGAWLAGLANRAPRLAQSSLDCRAALDAASDLYDSVDDALHRLVQVSNQKNQDLEALSGLASLVQKLEKCEEQLDGLQEQLEEFKDPPLSLSRLALQQHKFRSFRTSTVELHSRTLDLLTEIENWSELDWAGLGAVLKQLPPIREKIRGTSHCLSDCGGTLDNTQRLLSTLTEASQWCDVVSSSSPLTPPSSPLSTLPPIPPSRFQDARALALELGGGALLELWAQTLERYQRTLAQFKSSILQAERGTTPTPGPDLAPAQGPKTLGSASTGTWDTEGEGEGQASEGGEGGLQSWGSLASVFRPQNCSTLKNGEDRRKEAPAGSAGGGKFLQNLLNPNKKNAADVPLPPKPPRKRHPSFDLQALLVPRRATPVAPKPAETPCSTGGRSTPLSWMGRKGVAESVLTAGMAAAVTGWKEGGEGGGGGVLIRGVEVSSKEVVDQTGFSRKHVLLGRTERETGVERVATTAQSKLYVQWCRLLNSERQYVSVLKAVEEHYLPLLEGVAAPPALRGKADLIFSNWSDITDFHSRFLLPAIEGALSQTLQQTHCFSKYVAEWSLYSHYIHNKPEPDSAVVTQVTEFYRTRLSGSPALSVVSFPQCLLAPVQRLQYYCSILEDLEGVNPAPGSALSIIRHAQRCGEDLRLSDLITGCPVAVPDRGDLVRQGELYLCLGGRRKKTGIRNVFLYQHYAIFTKPKSSGTGRSVYCYKHCIKISEMGMTQSVGEDGLRFEVWVRQAPRTKDCFTLQTSTVAERESWTHDIAKLLWTHAIHNTELCLKESLCMAVSSKLLLDVTGSQISELEPNNSVTETCKIQRSCSDSSSTESRKETATPTQEPNNHSSSPSTSI
ncbi:rho guanine nucleotide exchange factor 40 [Trichomycterus rosablanca]|uniref:rho guanine nucleotide exchange factor 40 n=1 Tax=Trichomycterus rosablanca TaxID=2290929 RepID=UPI002F35E331